MVKEELGDSILKINNLTVRLGGKTILDNISFNVKKGEMLGIVGVSGAGKTTLLNSIIGYYSVSKGTVLYNSPTRKKFIEILKYIDYFKGLFGFSAQNPSFYPELSVIENLEYFASLYDIPADIKKSNIIRALSLVKLEEHAEKISKNLSGGMQKRLDIACAIVHHPAILILDEPTSDMDPLLRVQIWSLIEEINRNGTTVIVASHFLSEVEHACDRMVFLQNKRIEFSGTPKEFRNLHAKVKEIHIATREGSYDLILRKIKNIPFLEVKHTLRKKGKIIVHSMEKHAIIRGALSRLVGSGDIANIDIINPSMDTLFKLFVEK